MGAALVLGLVIGVLLGLVGGGGSVLAVPALLYGLGMPLASAIPTALLVVGVSAAAGAVPRIRAGQVRWRITAIFGAAGMGSAVGGAAVHPLLEPRTVLLGFTVLMIITGIGMLAGPPRAAADCGLAGDRGNWRRCLPKAIGAGTAVGFLTGLFGIGGGFVIVPALVLLLGLSMPLAVGTSLVVIVLNSAAGFLAYVGRVHLDYQIAVAFAATAIAGSLLATRFASRLSADRLRRWFAYLIFLTAALVLGELVLGRTVIA